MKYFISLLTMTLFYLFIMNVTYADASSNLMSAKKINGLTKTIMAIKSQTKYAIPFPHFVPKSDQPLYAGQSSYAEKSNYNEYWIITIATNSKCASKGCVIGSLSASTTDKLDLDYIQAPFDQSTKPTPKEKIVLQKGVIAYFTPGHAEADWHSPTLEWRQSGVLYVLSWNLDKNAKQIFIDMMN